MNTLSKKHWLVFSAIIFFNIIAFFIASFGTIVPVLEALLCLLLIRNYLKEPLAEYGIHFKNIKTQIISGIILAYIMLFLVHYRTISNPIFYVTKGYMKHFSLFPSFLSVFLYYFNILLYVIPEEIMFRGFLLSFFHKLFNNSLLSIFICAFLFGISHYPLGQSLNQVIFTSIFGILFGYLRIKEPDKFTIFSLSLAHFLYNSF